MQYCYHLALSPLCNIVIILTFPPGNVFFLTLRAWTRNLIFLSILQRWNSLCTPTRIRVHRNHLLDHPYVLYSFGEPPHPRLHNLCTSPKCCSRRNWSNIQNEKMWNDFVLFFLWLLLPRMWGNVPNQWNGKLWQWPVCYRQNTVKFICICILLLLYFTPFDHYVFVFDRCRSVRSH